MYDYTCSDHRPLTVTLSCMPSTNNNDIGTNAPSCSYDASDWANADQSVTSLYRRNLEQNLTNVVVLSCLINCCSQKCNDSAHAAIIDAYYHSVIECVKHTVDSTIPARTLQDLEYNIPGWNDVVQAKYELFREAFLEWVSCGRLRPGAIFMRMSRLKSFI